MQVNLLYIGIAAILLPLVLSCTTPLIDSPYISSPRPHSTNPNKFYVDVRRFAWDEYSYTGVVDIPSQTISADNHENSHSLSMTPLPQNNSYILNNVNDTLVVHSWIINTTTSSSSSITQYIEVITCVGILPDLANVDQIGIFYSSKLNSLYIWYRATTGDDRVAMVPLANIYCIDPLPLIHKPASIPALYSYDYFKKYNQVYDNEGLYYLYYGLPSQTSLCVSGFWIPLLQNDLGTPPFASQLDYYADNRANAKWFVGVNWRQVTVSSFNGSSNISFAIPLVDLNKILHPDPNNLGFGSGLETGVKVVIGILAGIGAICIMSCICACYCRARNNRAALNKSPVNATPTIKVRTSEHSDQVASPNQITYSEL